MTSAEWYHNKNYDEFFNFWDNFKGWNCFFKRLGFNEGQELIIKDQAKLELLSNDEYAFDSFERILHATLCAPKKS